MIHGVTLNYNTGHVTGRGGSASPKTALQSEKLLFRKNSVIVAVSIAFGFLKDTTFLL